MKHPGKKIAILGGIVCIFLGAWYLYQSALTSSVYQGLPTVPCFDTTQPVRQAFQVHITITVDGQPYPLEPRIGYDYGKCMHTMYTTDASGVVYIRANDTSTYTLGQFFDVWHKTFSNTQIMTYKVESGHRVHILVNGKEVNSGRETPLRPNDVITISYQ